MKATLLAVSLLALSASAFAANTAVSISVGQPGFYGRIDIGDYPAPQVIYRQPVLIERPVRYVETAPIYLRVPPGHAKNWRRHCHAYHACNQSVYFVQDGWYNKQYVPRYRERHGYGGPRHAPHHNEHRPDHGKGHGRGPDHGRGADHGRGHDRHER